MNHIKSFNKFNENVIQPYDFDKYLMQLEKSKNLTIESLNKILQNTGVEFINKDYFKSKLQTNKEIELVPKGGPMMDGINFAAYNIYTDRMYICIDENEFLKSLNNTNSDKKRDLVSFLNEILRHESIHRQQHFKRKDKITIRNLEHSPEEPEKYFGSTDEIMAYAQSYVDQCRKRGISDNEIISKLNNDNISWVYFHVYSKMPEKVKNRFKKYVYQYLNLNRTFNKKIFRRK